MPSGFILDDGIIAWYDGPEWNDVVAEVFLDYAPQVEQEAKANAPWADQTGRARDGLNTAVMTGEEVTLDLAHGEDVEYGFWLEVIQNGNFAIIMPTLEQFAPRIMRDAAKAVASARKGRD